ncbi:MAG: hypothetical protein AMXMBFR55_11470 [Gemmatimonadota bacterium]
MIRTLQPAPRVGRRLVAQSRGAVVASLTLAPAALPAALPAMLPAPLPSALAQLPALLLLVLLLAACGFTSPEVRAEGAVMVPPTGGAPAAVYLTLVNHGRYPDTLRGITAPGVGAVSLVTQRQHRSPTGGDGSRWMAMTAPVSSVAIAPGGDVAFSPGGVHGVVARLQRPLVLGETVALALHLTDRRVLSVRARVVAFTALDSAPSPRAATGGRNAAAVPGGCALYRANGCASCHGADGRGDGPIAATLDPRPRDFRDARAFRNGIDTAAIAQTLATGIPGGGAMPRYAHLTIDERRTLAGFLISLRASPPHSTPLP